MPLLRWEINLGPSYLSLGPSCMVSPAGAQACQAPNPLPVTAGRSNPVPLAESSSPVSHHQFELNAKSFACL